MFDLLRRFFVLEFGNFYLGLGRLGRFGLRLRFVQAIGRIEGFALRNIGRFGHGQADAADEFHVDLAFGAATDVPPAITLKVKDDGHNHGGRDSSVKDQGIDEEAAKAEVVSRGERRVGGVGGHVIECGRGR